VISISFYRRQFGFFLALVGLGMGIGYLALNQTSLATGRPLQLPLGRDTVTLAVQDYGRVSLEGSEVSGVVRFAPTKDDFSYLLLDGLDHAIDNLTVTVTWPRPVAINEADVNALLVHTVPAPWSWKWIDDQTLTYHFTKLDPSATVSLLVTLPKNVVAPSLTQKLFGTIRSLPHVVWLSFALVLPLLSLGILCLLLFLQGRKHRQPKIGRIRDLPPDTLAPAAVSALLDGHVSARALAATLFDLARRDYLDIGRTGKSYVFTKRRRLLSPAGGHDLLPFELALLEKLFPAAAAQVSEEDMRVRIGSSLFSKKVASMYLGIYEIVTARGFFHQNPSLIQGTYRLAGLFLFFIGLLGFGLGVALFSDAPTPILLWVGMMVSALIIVNLSPRITNYTTSGLAAREQWLAFRNYLAEAQPITFTMQTQEDFFRYLPYAMAMGIEVEWARRFLTAPFRLPDWYSSEARVAGLEDFVNDIFPMVGFLARELAAVKEPTLS
jgi:hypothetical protein